MSHDSLLGNFPPPVISKREEPQEENGSDCVGGNRKQKIRTEQKQRGG